MEGKEVRFAFRSSLFAVSTTVTRTGAVDSTHDRFPRIGGVVPLFTAARRDHPGWDRCRALRPLVLAIVGVFIAGLMVGRTPDYLGKKIEAFEIKMAMLVVLVCSPSAILASTAIASCHSGSAPLANQNLPYVCQRAPLRVQHARPENNGSAFAGLTGNTDLTSTSRAASRCCSAGSR